MTEQTMAICDIDVKLTSDDVTALLRALALAERNATGGIRDDLEVLRQRIYLQAFGIQLRSSQPAAPGTKRTARLYSTSGRIRVWDEEGGVAA